MVKTLAEIFIIMTLLLEMMIIFGMNSFLPVVAAACAVVVLVAIIYHFVKRFGNPAVIIKRDLHMPNKMRYLIHDKGFNN